MPEHQQRPYLENVRDKTAMVKSATQQRDNAIREALADGVSGTELAKVAGLSRQRIYQIKLGKN